MMTSTSNANTFRVAGPLWGKSIGPLWIPPQMSVTGSSNFFFNLRLNKRRLSKQLSRRWFETPSRSSWRHCNGSSFSCFSWEGLTRMNKPNIPKYSLRFIIHALCLAAIIFFLFKYLLSIYVFAQILCSLLIAFTGKRGQNASHMAIYTNYGRCNLTAIIPSFDWYAHKS